MAGPAGRTRWNTNVELIGTGRPLRRRELSRQVTRRAAAGPAASTRGPDRDRGLPVDPLRVRAVTAVRHPRALNGQQVSSDRVGDLHRIVDVAVGQGLPELSSVTAPETASL
jgi:hypothetical protein